jgi:hypothetical protein
MIQLNPIICFRDYLSLRQRYTFIQLGRMKHIVDCGESIRKSDVVSNWPTYFNDFIRSNVVWC